MKKLYYYLFFCFYSILNKNDSERLEGATSLLTILSTSIIFSAYFLSHIWFDYNFYYPVLEIIFIVILCLLVWLLNRKLFIKNRKGTVAISKNQNRNLLFPKILGLTLTIGQIALFIISGIITSRYVWQW